MIKPVLQLAVPKLKAAIKAQNSYDNGAFSANDSYNLATFKTDNHHARVVAKIRWHKYGMRKTRVVWADVKEWIESQSDYSNVLLLQKLPTFGE